MSDKSTAEKPKRISKQNPNGRHYISNKEFTKDVSEWIYRRREGSSEKMPDSVAISVMKLVENYGHKRNYSGYSYLEDMKGEALLTCVKYAHNFNPDKSQNAFAYFTQIIDNAFKGYLNKERTQHDIKFKFISEESQISKHNYNNIKLDDSSCDSE